MPKRPCQQKPPGLSRGDQAQSSAEVAERWAQPRGLVLSSATPRLTELGQGWAGLSPSRLGSILHYANETYVSTDMVMQLTLAAFRGLHMGIPYLATTGLQELELSTLFWSISKVLTSNLGRAQELELQTLP
nr:hypothetical protein Iba_chr13dCG3420 [Ipomoea batatas]